MVNAAQTCRLSALVVALLCVKTVVGHGRQEEPPDPQHLWELAVIAKGGRERLGAIQSFAIRETTRFKRPLREFASGRVDQIVCRGPDLWWEFLDYRPGKMGYSVTVVDARTGLGWATHGGPAREFLRPDTNTPFRMRDLQYVYFLETHWVQPTPVAASRSRVGPRRVDRVETHFADDVIVFFLDATTHLAVRIEIARKISRTPPRPDLKPVIEMSNVVELADYRDVGGMQVPERVVRGRDPADARVELNPDYDPSIFTKPPSPQDGIESWRRVSARIP